MRDFNSTGIITSIAKKAKSGSISFSRDKERKDRKPTKQFIDGKNGNPYLKQDFILNCF